MKEEAIAELERLEREARRPIPGYPGYEASHDGNIWSIASNWRGYGPRALAAHPNRYGYKCVGLMVNGRKRRLPVHRLVALAFHGIPTHEQQVRHLNGDKLDNRSANLRWGTALENAVDREIHGRTARGDRSGAKTHPERLARGTRCGVYTHPEKVHRGERSRFAKLSEKDVLRIRERRALGEQYTALAADFGVDQSLIGHIVHRRIWKHVP